MKNYYQKKIYLLLIPATIFTIIFSYIPMAGIYMAFSDYEMFASDIGPFFSIFASDFVGLENFKNILTDHKFIQVFFNTPQISILKIIFVFPLPIICAVLINEIIWPKTKKIIQTILYMPHFLSWVIVSGIWLTILGGSGLINDLLLDAQIASEPIPFLTEGSLFIPVLLITDAWKEVGWSAIIYLAAMTSIDSQLYEAVKIDGGNKFHEIFKVTIPGIANTIVMMFILRISSIMDAGFDQIFNMYSIYVYDVADVLSTYVYRLGLGDGEYSLATAVGLFNSVIAFSLILIANALAKKYTKRSIW